MFKELPKLKVYPNATPLSEVAQDQKQDMIEIIDFANSFYGKKRLQLGSKIGSVINSRMRTTQYAPYVRDIEDTVDVIGDNSVRGLQHSFSIGCSTQVRDVESDGIMTPTIMGTLDWEQIGDNLASIVSMSVMENPIQTDKPVLSCSIGPAAFGFFLMNEHLTGKLNRAPIPNIRNKRTDFEGMDKAEYNKVKARNADVYMLSTVAKSAFLGRPSCSYLLRHAFNKSMSYDETVDYIVKTKTSDFGIITLAGKVPGQAVTIEKRASDSFVRSGYESAANHWDREGKFGKKFSLPRTLNSYDRAEAMADTSRPSIFADGSFVFANAGVVDDTTRIIMEMSAANGRMSLVACKGQVLTSQAVTGHFDGRAIERVEHFTPEMAM